MGSNEIINAMMVPEDLADNAVLVPIDVSVKAFGEVYDGHEEMVEKIGTKGVTEAVIEAAKLFETSKKNFKDSEMPIPMTVAEWKQAPGETDDEDEDADEEDDAEDGNGGDDEGEEEEEEDGDDEEEDEEPA